LQAGPDTMKVQTKGAVMPGLAEDALAGLLSTPKTLPAKYFYDEVGMGLFGEITRLDEYYLTRAELQILTDFGPNIARQLPGGSVLVEFGASDFSKARLLLSRMREPAGYLALDINLDAAEACADLARGQFPHLKSRGMSIDFLGGGLTSDFSSFFSSASMVGYFAGSTIGNFSYPQAVQFLSNARNWLADGGKLLLAADLIKNVERLIAAYDDKSGVTAAFNLNLLTRLNRELGANFDAPAFRHRAIWNSSESSIEMHLESLLAQSVEVLGRSVDFKSGETIHTESSRKYTLDALRRLATAAEWHVGAQWTDAKGDFSLSLLE
jgi:L-histidine Nalpha-methyltransferase